jgi:hypothetical protein
VPLAEELVLSKVERLMARRVSAAKQFVLRRIFVHACEHARMRPAGAQQ